MRGCLRLFGAILEGYVGGVSDANIDLLHKFSLDDFYPDLTFYLDLDVSKGLERANSRKTNEKRFESKGLEFHENIRKSYLKLASDEPARIYIIDASKSISKIHYEITKIVEDHMSVPCKLIETVCEKICDSVIEISKKIQKVKVSVTKINPPIEGDVESVKVEIGKKQSY